MSRANMPLNADAGRQSDRGFDGDLAFLDRFDGPLLFVARAMLAYLFVPEGVEKIAGYASVAGYMAQHGVAPSLLPLVILTEVGGGLLVFVGLKTRWAAIALFGFCLLTAALFHVDADQKIQFTKNIAIAGGFLALAAVGPGAWSLDGWRGRAR